MARHYAHNPRMIADLAYGGRMGNQPPPSDDGWNYRGAGLSQVTGREGFARLQKKLAQMKAGIDILEHPALIISPEHTLECGVADWINCGCKPWAAKDDLLRETKALNGGTNGLEERKRQLALWKIEFGLTRANNDEPAPPSRPRTVTRTAAPFAPSRRPIQKALS